MGASTDFGEDYARVLATVAKTNGQDGAYDLMDSISRTMGQGAEYSRYSDVFYGLNRLPNLAPLALHSELQGLVLFTRPNLNLSYDNIAVQRTLAQLLTQDPNSVPYAVRMMLDPTTYKGAKQSPLVDQKNPYLTLLTNSITSMSNPPDIGLNAYTSSEGMMKEAWIMNDSISDYNGKYDLTCTFTNFKSNAMLALFHSWITYISCLRVGPCIPHPLQRIRDEMDYFTRIERIKLDATGRYIVGWFHSGASFPTNLSIGAGFGYSREEATEFENKQLSVQFASVGAVYNDPIQLYEFNLRIARQNPGMSDARRRSEYTRIPYQYFAATNYNGYPYIDLGTLELQWFVDNESYKQLTKGL